MTLYKLIEQSKELGLSATLTELSIIYGYKPTYLTDVKRKNRKLPQPLLNQVELLKEIKKLKGQIMTQAKIAIQNKNFFTSEKTNLGAVEPIDTNSEVHDFLTDECVSFKEICGQDTWIFGDNSYITRIEDEYWDGDDCEMFKLNE